MRARHRKCVRSVALLVASSLFINLSSCVPKDPLYKIATTTGMAVFDTLTALVVATVTDAIFLGQTDTAGDETTDGDTAGDGTTDGNTAGNEATGGDTGG